MEIDPALSLVSKRIKPLLTLSLMTAYFSFQEIELFFTKFIKIVSPYVCPNIADMV